MGRLAFHSTRAVWGLGWRWVRWPLSLTGMAGKVIPDHARKPRRPPPLPTGKWRLPDTDGGNSQGSYAVPTEDGQKIGMVGCPPSGSTLKGMPMTSYAAPAPVRVDQLKRNDLVRVNTFLGSRKELEIWATVLEISPWQQNPGANVSIQLAGGYKFVAKPDRQYDCRVSNTHWPAAPGVSRDRP